MRVDLSRDLMKGKEQKERRPSELRVYIREAFHGLERLRLEFKRGKERRKKGVMSSGKAVESMTCRCQLG